MIDRLDHDRDFQTVIDEVAEWIRDETIRNEPLLNHTADCTDCVYLKNPSGVLLAVNEPYRDFFSRQANPVGRNAQTFLDASIADVANQSDAMVIGSAQSLEFEHIGRGSDGATYKMQTHKRPLRDLGEPGLAILGVTRPVARLAPTKDGEALDFSEKFRRFSALSQRDQWICQQIAAGLSSRQIGEELELTRRAVELRKQKALQQLGVDSGVDLVKLMVRLQDRGFVDLGL